MLFENVFCFNNGFGKLGDQQRNFDVALLATLRSPPNLWATFPAASPIIRFPLSPHPTIFELKQSRMSKNVFDQPVAAELMSRLQALQNVPPQWGKMNAAQMMVHCQMPLKIATGELQLSRGLFGWLFGKMMKRKFLSNGFGKNLPTEKAFIIASEHDFDAEKKSLLARIQQFTQLNQDALAATTHPFFGKMTAAEWGIISYQHLDHHLRQFNA
jgi:hypothetical protein